MVQKDSYPPPSTARSRRPLSDALGVFVVVLIATKSLQLCLPGSAAWFYRLLAPVIFLLVPAFALRRSRIDPLQYVGLERSAAIKSLKICGISAAIVIPLFVIGYVIFRSTILGKSIHTHVDWSLPSIFLTQLVVVAFPEEFLFRGYIQGKLGERWKGGVMVFGAKLGPAILVTAALFALGHFVTRPMFYRFGTFFPALVFGWLRERSGSVAGPILFHAIANLTIFILEGAI